MTDFVFGRVIPGPPTTVTAPEAYAEPARAIHDGRPWVLIDMITSVDGATAIESRAGGLGRAGDYAVFHTLRALADVVLVGAGTARVERYGPPRREGLRIALVTASGRLDGLDRLLASGGAIVVTTEEAPAPPGGLEVVRVGRGRVDPALALAALAERGARVVVAEGGPTLNGDLLQAGVVDEVCATVAPLLVSGTSPRFAHGPPIDPLGLRLAHVLADDEGYLYTRWLVEH